MGNNEVKKVNVILDFLNNKISSYQKSFNNLLDEFYNEDRNIRDPKYAVIYKKIKEIEYDLSNFYIIRDLLQEFRKIKSYYKIEIDKEKLNELYNRENIKESEENK